MHRKGQTMSEHGTYDQSAGRAAAINLGSSEIPAEELARQADRAQAMSPGPRGDVSESELARERDVADAINPGPQGALAVDEVAREAQRAAEVNLGPQG